MESTPSWFAKWRDEHLPFFEGNIPHLYLDTKGVVTVGVGHAFFDEDQFKEFLSIDSNMSNCSLFPDGSVLEKKPFKTDDALTIFRAVKKMSKGLVNKESYKKNGYLKLNSIVIQALLTDDTEDTLKNLKNRFVSLSSYPEHANMALADLMYNIGPTKFCKEKWSKFWKGLEAEDWITCAKECNREGIQADRNNTIKSWFEAAAKEKSKSVTPTQATQQAQQAISEQRVYPVQPSDSWDSLELKFELSREFLAAASRGYASTIEKLTPGDNIVVPIKQSVNHIRSECLDFYAVVLGETMASISNKINFPLQILDELNPGVISPHKLEAGEVINVPKPIQKVTSKSKLHVIKKGETLSAIAVKYGVKIDELINKNRQIRNPSFIKAGDVLVIST